MEGGWEGGDRDGGEDGRMESGSGFFKGGDGGRVDD